MREMGRLYFAPGEHTGGGRVEMNNGDLALGGQKTRGPVCLHGAKSNLSCQSVHECDPSLIGCTPASTAHRDSLEILARTSDNHGLPDLPKE